MSGARSGGRRVPFSSRPLTSSEPPSSSPCTLFPSCRLLQDSVVWPVSRGWAAPGRPVLCIEVPVLSALSQSDALAVGIATGLLLTLVEYVLFFYVRICCSPSPSYFAYGVVRSRFIAAARSVHGGRLCMCVCVRMCVTE